MKYRSLLLALMLALGLLYSYRVADRPLDYDERYSLNIATGIGGHTSHFYQYGTFIAEPLPSIVFSSKDYANRYKIANVISTAMNDNGQGLPYFILQHEWLAIVGVTTTNARALSLIFIILSIPLFFFLLRKWGLSDSNSLLFTALLFCNGVIIGLATYVRFYALGILLTIISCYLVTHLFGKKISLRQSLLLGLVWSLFFFTQYFSIFIIAAQFLFLISTKDKAVFRRLIPAFTVGLAALLIWLFAFGGWECWRNIYHLQTTVSSGSAAIPSSSPIQVLLAWFSALNNVVGQPILLAGKAELPVAALLLALPSWLCIFYTLFNKKIPKPFWIKLSLLGLAIYSFGSIIHAFATGYTLLFFGRYWVFVYLLSYGLLAWTWAQRTHFSKLFQVISVAFIVLMIGRSAYTITSFASGLNLTKSGKVQPMILPQESDYENLAQDVLASYSPGDTVVYSSWQNAQMSNWFLLEKPELMQKVDTNQKPVATIRNADKVAPLMLHLGYRKSARAAWFQ
ncbi:MAG: hypothetical protein ABI378_04920 [Chitinophagaceae bacterium]